MAMHHHERITFVHEHQLFCLSPHVHVLYTDYMFLTVCKIAAMDVASVNVCKFNLQCRNTQCKPE